MSMIPSAAAGAITLQGSSAMNLHASGGIDLNAPLELNPFSLSDDVISNHIIGIHDSHATKYDVNPLFNVVSNIVKSSTHIGHSLDLKRPKAVELIEDKVPQSTFMPPFSTLKEIACQMTCQSFSPATAHKTIVEILEKLQSYTWDAKAVIALSAFALDYGETWRLSLMETTKDNALELHIFKLGQEAKPSKHSTDLISTLVDSTLHLIDGIMQLEKKIADKTNTLGEVPTLYAAPRDIYTYWAILALLACANRMTEMDRTIKSEVVGKLKLILARLNNDLHKIEVEEEKVKDLKWRLEVFHSSSGIVQLLRALIFPQDLVQLEIFDNTAKQVVSNNVLKTKNFLLFISGLDNIEDEIWVLKSIHEALIKDKKKRSYQILWVPVVDKCDAEEKEKFENLKSKMPWYVLQNLFVIKGRKPLEMVWHYQGKPIVVVTNLRGDVVHKNALHMIFVWKIQAFPFRPEDEEKLSLHWNWFWNEAAQVYPEIEKWIREDKYIFIYGGTDIAWTQRFGTLLDDIRKDPIIKQADTIIEHFNLGKVDLTTISKFWGNIINSFLSKVQKDNYDHDFVVKDIQKLLSVKNEKGWALVSKGNNILEVGYDLVMTSVFEEFKEWRLKVQELQGFDNAFKDYYNYKKPQVPPHCLHFQLSNIRSGIPMSFFCPDPTCKMKMEIETVSYKCCHGIHYDHAGENDKNLNVTPRMMKWTP